MAVSKGINGGHHYSNLVCPIEVDLSFIVDSTNANGLGLRSLKSNGFVKSAFMNAASAPSGSPAMGTARSFGILGASAVTNTGNSVLTGNLGISPGSAITGFPPGTFSGAQHITDAAAAAAQSSALAAYTDLQARTPTIIATALNGQSLTAGVYKAASGTFTIDAAVGALTLTGSATDIFVFQTTTTLVTGTTGAAVITLAGGALASNVYWVVGSSATLSAGTASIHKGNVIALTSITSTTTGGSVLGSLVALNGAVTLSAATTITTQPFSAPAATAAAGSPNPAAGFAEIIFNSNYNKYIGGYANYVSPLTGTNVAINSTLLTLGKAYVISVLGTSTAADWLAIGLPAGVTAAVGQSFICIKTGNGSGTGKVQLPLVSQVNSVEVIGDPNLMISNSSVSVNGGAILIVQFLANNVLTAPADGSTVNLTACFDGSSVTVDGL